MEKQELLQEIRAAAADKKILRDEMIAAYDAGVGVPTAHPSLLKRMNIADVLYFIGGAIVFIGIAILVGQHWDELDMPTRILATLGSGIAAYIVGVLLSRDERFGVVGTAFFFLSALIMPVGLSVVFDAAGLEVGSAGMQSVIAGILLVAYLASFFVFPRTLFIVFSILFGTWLFFSFTSFLILNNPHLATAEFFEYRVLAVGLAYVFLGYALREAVATTGESHEEYSALASWLYAGGVALFLGAALALGGWSPNQNAFWEVIFPGLVFGVIFLSIYLHARSFLAFGSVYLMAYILKITAEYFSDTLGWPLALVLAGLCLIAIGYGAFRLNQNYLVKGVGEVRP
ncbi:MAG: hypothetical protein Q8Q94_03025 [bacterium]|nr:hypothetical protein [bacterium]MDZ4299517.1 hypothetical protein [Candidatus Sungbacteria bacterium]